jgi:hypothetical protein
MKVDHQATREKIVALSKTEHTYVCFGRLCSLYYLLSEHLLYVCICVYARTIVCNRMNVGTMII